MTPKKSPILQYVCLTLLFALAASYQVRALMYAFPNYFHLNAVQFPFELTYSKGHPLLTFVSESARQAGGAGLRDGDELLSVNGRRVTGLAVFGETMRRSKPGDEITVAILRPGEAAPRKITLQLKQASAPPLSLAAASLFAIKLAVPILCILLGFWVVAVRPRDPSAWSLCLIMTFFSTFFSAGVESWGAVVRDIAQAYRMAVDNSWPIFMLLFGLYFPEPLAGKNPLWWKWARRSVIGLLILFCALNVIASVGQLEDFAAVASLTSGLEHLGGLEFLLSFTAIGAFFALIAIKLKKAVAQDAKRRLRLLYTGSTISLAPACILFVTQAIRGADLEQIFPEWILLSGLSLMLLFPITLAYVIVVHRAMDVRVVIREGLQYALARGGIRVLQGILTGAILFVGIYYTRSHHLSLANEITAVALLLVAILRLRSAADLVRAWIDRRFFRDAYQAEQILEVLSEEVRTIVEKRPLLERVATRIAESLHVPRVAVLLEDNGWYRPAFALGYSSPLETDLPDSSATVRHLKREAMPERIFLNDEKSWVNSPGVAVEEREKLATLHSQLLVPLTVKEKLLGIISLGEKRAEAPYSGSDIRVLKSVAAQAALALSNAALTSAIADEIARREKLNREIEIAREVQERLFPQHLPEIEGLDYFGRCRTALGVGGDYYDFLALPGGKLGIALGDVSGKGIAAALTMASLEASLRAEAMRAGNDVAGLVTRVNRMLYDASTEDRYATFFYAQYEPTTRRLTYVNAGHCPPMLLRNASKPHRQDSSISSDGGRFIERLDKAGGTVVGLLPDCDYEQADVTLNTGDLLVIYSDGFSEAMSPKLEEWGEQRLLAAVASCDGLPANDCVAKIMQAADAFAAGAPQSDDMTLVVLRIL
ncbi:MAG TPA: SpoIIE family protein phosphatase [Candidatus Acidoferrum sp.]|nr:SpoIIE family protein phosphatase [Candidatus Acidoferrum sp.]